MDDILNFERKKEDDYYFILGCNENSTEAQIMAEYKSRVLSCHPDKNQDDKTSHDKFAKLSEAKEVLLDAEKRKEYDRWRNSQLAIPFHKWKSMGHVKTSMHWGHRKEQVAIDHSKNEGYTTQNFVQVSSSASGRGNDECESSSLRELQEQFRFIPREKPADSQFSGCQWETTNPMLLKFRNYQI